MELDAYVCLRFVINSSPPRILSLTRTMANTKAPVFRDSCLPMEDRISDLLSCMTLEEKVGQMTQIDRTVATPQVIKHFFIGSVLNGGDSALPPTATPSMWADMIDGFQQSSMSTRLGIPILYGADAVHGHSNASGTTVFPHNIGLGAAKDEELMVRIGAVTALEARATGVHYAFAPCIAVCRDPRWGRCYESYSEDTDIVQSLGKHLILGLQGFPPENHPQAYPYVSKEGAKVVACAKHYAGDGGTEGGIDEYNFTSTYDDLYRLHIRPYVDALATGVSTVMASYSSWNGEKMHTNHHLLTIVLKKELGFQGFVISDWEGIDRITEPAGSNYRESVKKAINAGIDMVMVPYNYKVFIDDLTSLVLSGEVAGDRIDDAVRRILRVKFAAGMFDRPPMAYRSLLNLIGCKKHREVAREAVRKSLVLLKNGKDGDEPMLPLSKKAGRILVAGSHANNIGYQCGGWTITWAGKSGNVTQGTTILEGIRAAMDKETEVVFKEDPDDAFMENNGPFSYAIVVVGEAPYVEWMGDDLELNIPLGGPDVITRVSTNTRCLVVLISGRPMVIEPHLPAIDALVAAWLPGTEAGSGIADIIFGDFDFHGKLPRTWFRRVDQLPMNVGDLHYDPLYPFGFGLRMKN